LDGGDADRARDGAALVVGKAVGLGALGIFRGDDRVGAFLGLAEEGLELDDAAVAGLEGLAIFAGDGAEGDVFSLVGPKRFDVPWKELEAKGWIATAVCTEIRLDLPEHQRIPYAVAAKREKFRIASENPLKEEVVKQLIDNHREDAILVIGQYIDQLERLSRILKAPLITGSTPNSQRDVLYQQFRLLNQNRRLNHLHRHHRSHLHLL
jgi:hypothetical protein